MGGRISKDISSFYFTKVSKNSPNGKELLSEWKIDPMDLLLPLTEEKLSSLEKDKIIPLELLYERNRSGKKKDLKGSTPLHLASELRNIQLLEDMVKAILDSDRINNFEEGNKHGETSTPVFNVDWNIRNEQGLSPLSVAVEKESIDSIQLLIDVGADPNEPFCTIGREADERWTWSYLRYAAWHGKIRSLQALLTVKNIGRSWDKDGKRAIHLAVENNQLESVKILLDHDLKQYFNESNVLHPSYYESARKLAVELFIVRAPDPTLKTVSRPRLHITPEIEDSSAQRASPPPLELLELLRGALRLDNPPEIDISSTTEQQVVSVPSNNILSSKDRGSTLIHLAAACGNEPILNFFLSHPAFSNNFQSLNEFGKAPIFMAVRHGHIGCINSLRNAGVSLSSADIENWSIMHEAVKYQHIDILNLLIENGCDVNFADDDGWTPLHVAARFCVTDAVEPLMASGADLNAVTEDNESVLQIAVAQKNNETLLSEILQYEPNYFCVFGSPQSPERILMERRDFSMLRVFLEHVRKTSLTNDKLKHEVERALHSNSMILHRCVHNGDFDIMKTLLDMGADVSSRNQAGETVLFYAVRKRLATAVSTILGYNCNPDITNRDGTRPIHVACDSGHSSILQLLLSHGSNAESPVPSTAQNGGFTPLMLAARRGHESCVEVLEMHGVNLNAQKEDGYSALHLTALNGHVNALRSLINSGADTEVVEQNGFVPLHVSVRNQQFDATSALLAGGANPQATGPSKLSPLHFAAHVCDSRSVWLLIQCGVSVTAADDHDATPLHYACRQPRGQSCVQLLLTCGSDLNSKEYDGDTPLHCAAQEGIIQTVRILLKRGAEPGLKNKLGQVPLHIAVAKGSDSITQALLKYGSNGAEVDLNGETPFDIAVRIGNKEARLLIWRSLGFQVDDVAPERRFKEIAGTDLQNEDLNPDSPHICVICQNAFENDEVVRVLPCKHQYHSSCILEWFGGNLCDLHDYCPLCQLSIVPKKLPDSIRLEDENDEKLESI